MVNRWWSDEESEEARFASLRRSSDSRNYWTSAMARAWPLICILILLLAACGSGRGSADVQRLEVEQLPGLTFQAKHFEVHEAAVKVTFISRVGAGTLIVVGVEGLALQSKGKPVSAVVDLKPGTYSIGSIIPSQRVAGLVASLKVVPLGRPSK